MPSPGLSRGARLLRRWREYSHLRYVHPVRWNARMILSGPVAVSLLALFGLAWCGERLSSLRCTAENWRDRFLDRFAETEREHKLRARAWWSEHNKPGLKGI